MDCYLQAGGRIGVDLMTAEEMFKKLGYTKRAFGDCIFYGKGRIMRHIIQFNLKDKILYSYTECGMANATKSLTANELKMAIIQQCIELGWLEEETCTNVSEYDSTEEFRCSNCGFTLVEHKEYAIGEDDGEEYYFAYKPKYCPNCGRKIID